MRYSYLQTKNFAPFRSAKKQFLWGGGARQSSQLPTIKNNRFEKSNTQDLCTIYTLLLSIFDFCNP